MSHNGPYIPAAGTIISMPSLEYPVFFDRPKNLITLFYKDLICPDVFMEKGASLNIHQKDSKSNKKFKIYLFSLDGVHQSIDYNTFHEEVKITATTNCVPFIETPYGLKEKLDLNFTFISGCKTIENYYKNASSAKDFFKNWEILGSPVAMLSSKNISMLIPIHHKENLMKKVISDKLDHFLQQHEDMLEKIQSPFSDVE